MSLESVTTHVKSLKVSLERGGKTLVLLTALKTRLKYSLEVSSSQEGEVARLTKNMMSRAQEEFEEEEKSNEIDLRLEKY